MFTVALVIYVFLTLALIGVILIQKSEGGGLGVGGGGMSGFMTGRSTANLLTRTTAILAGLFMAMNILLAILASQRHSASSTIIEPVPSVPAANLAPAAAPKPGVPPAPALPPAPKSDATPAAPAPAAPAQPSVPLAK